MPKSRAEQITSELPDCQDCAACCFSTLERYVRVMGDDYERLGNTAEILVAFVGNRAYLRMIDGHCAALTQDVTTGRFRCQVYESRPAICRHLERGSAECAAERDYKVERSRLGCVARRSAASL